MWRAKLEQICDPHAVILISKTFTWGKIVENWNKLDSPLQKNENNSRIKEADNILSALKLSEVEWSRSRNTLVIRWKLFSMHNKPTMSGKIDVIFSDFLLASCFNVHWNIFTLQLCSSAAEKQPAHAQFASDWFGFQSFSPNFLRFMNENSIPFRVNSSQLHRKPSAIIELITH